MVGNGRIRLSREHRPVATFTQSFFKTEKSAGSFTVTVP